jgi:hypothetical protein
MTWFFQGMGFAAVMLIGVAAMGGFPSGSEKPSGHDAAVTGWMGGALPTTRTGGDTAMSQGALTSMPNTAIPNGNSWQTGASATSADLPPQMMSSLRAEERPSSIQPENRFGSQIRKAWNLWATAYMAFVHDLAPSEESIKRWWTGLAQELPSREFFESQLNELKAVQAKSTPLRRGGLVTMNADGYGDFAGLKEQAKKLNPVIGYWDPLNLADNEFWDQTNEATIGWLRESEIKHGRIAMFGFVGYIVHANGIRWPWKGPWDSIPTDISPQEMWDLQPAEAKWQIILTIGFLEFWRESQYVLEQDGEKHYMRGGKPGYFPTLDNIPHPVPFNLYDPFTHSKKKSPEKKAKGLITEINNGRLAMIGLMGFLAESQTPGSVPLLTSLGLKSYSGNIMVPFAAGTGSDLFTV